MQRSILLLATVLSTNCTKQATDTTAQTTTPPNQTQPAPAPAPTPEPTPKIYAPAEIADELRFDQKKTSPAWGQSITVQGLAVKGPVENSDNGQYYIPLANAIEHSSLHEVNCYVGTTPPAVEEGQTLVVTGTPFKPEFGNLWLRDCQILPKHAP